MDAVVDTWTAALPWIAVAGILVEFGGTDELRRPAFRRACLRGGVLLVAVSVPALVPFWPL